MTTVTLQCGACGFSNVASIRTPEETLVEELERELTEAKFDYQELQARFDQQAEELRQLKASGDIT